MLTLAESMHGRDCEANRHDQFGTARGGHPFWKDSCYNEVMLSREVWYARLPHAVQGIALGRGADVDTARRYRRLFTQSFGLSEQELPILGLDLPGNSTAPFSLIE
jgi:hypothetical protein